MKQFLTNQTDDLKFTDLYGNKIPAMYLDETIKKADYYRFFSNNDPALAEYDKQMQYYWQDVYEKLVLLKLEITHPK